MAESKRKQFEEREREAREKLSGHLKERRQWIKENNRGNARKQTRLKALVDFTKYYYDKIWSNADIGEEVNLYEERISQGDHLSYFEKSDYNLKYWEVERINNFYQVHSYNHVNKINWPECVVDLLPHFGLIDKYGLDIKKCTNECIVFRCLTGIADLSEWRKHNTVINLFLEMPVDIQQIASDEIALYPVNTLPDVIEFSKKNLAHGGIFIGYECRGGKPYFMSMRDMTHMLVMGISGVGKSVFLNQLVQGILYNIRYVERCYMVDFKGGVELFPYEAKSEKIRVLYRYDQMPAVASELVEKMYARLEQMRVNGQRQWKGSLIYFIVDEYAQIQLYKPIGKEAKERHAQLLADLNTLSMMGRGAGVRIIAQLQKGTTDVMDSSFRNNLQSQVCFKVRDNLTASGMFGSVEELPAQPTKLKRGRFIMYDDSTGETVYLQSCIVPDDFEVTPYEPAPTN